MTLRRSLLCLPALACMGIGMGVGAAPGQTRPPLLLVNAVYPPFVNPPGHAQGEGMDIEIAREALRRTGHTVQLQLVPWKRVLLMLELGQADLTTTISRNGDRDRYLRWTQSYRNGASYRFYTRKGSPLRLNSLAELAGRRLGTVAGFFYPDAITQQPGVIIDAARDVTLLTHKLHAGRIDIIVVSGIRGEWEIREAGLANTLVRQPYEYAAESPNYLAFSKSRSDDALLAATDAALDQMRKDGTLAAIERRYLKDLMP